MNPWINYHHLYYFKTIAEEESVSKAAQKLRVGQPTLSAQLRQFEDSLGVELFERQHKKLILTEQGRVALDYARSIFKMGSEMYEVLHDRIRPTRPALTVAALDNISKEIILKLVKSALRISPCQITLLEGHPDELLRELSAHRVDLLLTDFVPRSTGAKDLSHRILTKNNVAIYGSPRFKKLRKSFPESISGQPMILPTYDSKLRYDLDHWSQTHQVDFEILTESQDIATKILMASEGLGLIATAPHTVTPQAKSGDLIEIGQLQGVSEELILVTAKRRIENPIAAKLIQSFAV